MVALRSLLFAPGNSPRKLERATSFGADVVVYDLEDTVPENEKEMARSLVRHALDHHGLRTTGPRDNAAHQPLRAVRVNAASSPHLGPDLAAVLLPSTWGIVLPKLEDARQLAMADEAIAKAETAACQPLGSVRLIALVESARGLLALPEIVARPPQRLERFVLGTVDLARDLQLPVGDRGPVMVHAGATLAVASRAAGLERPLDGPYTNVTDGDGYVADCALSARLGFCGRVVLHPDQISPTHAAYARSGNELHWARRVVEAYERAAESGSGSLSLDGRFIDRAVYLAALATLGAYEKA